MKHRTRALLGAVFGLLLFHAGASLASSDDCHSASMTNCFTTDSSIETVCCADVDGQLRIANCTRDVIECAVQSTDQPAAWSETYGNGYNCYNIGDPCQ